MEGRKKKKKGEKKDKGNLMKREWVEEHEGMRKGREEGKVKIDSGSVCR